MLEVITPAASTDLVTLAETKSFLGISGTSEDTKLGLQISSASDAIQGWLGRTIPLETVEETLMCLSSTLVLRRWPVGTITSIVEEGVTLTAAQYKLESRTGIVRRTEAGATGFQLWAGHTVIRYSAGYANVPSALKEATFVAVKALIESARRESGVKSERLEGEASMTYFEPTGEGLPQEVLNRLEPYKAILL